MTLCYHRYDLCKLLSLCAEACRPMPTWPLRYTTARKNSGCHCPPGTLGGNESLIQEGLLKASSSKYRNNETYRTPSRPSFRERKTFKIYTRVQRYWDITADSSQLGNTISSRKSCEELPCYTSSRVREWKVEDAGSYDQSFEWWRDSSNRVQARYTIRVLLN